MWTKLISIPPVGVFGAAILMFGGWIAWESDRAPDRHVGADRQPVPPPSIGPTIGLTTGPNGLPLEVALGTVHVGSPRWIIEQRLNSLPHPEYDPIDSTSGTPVLRSRYYLHLTHPFPHLMPNFRPREFRAGAYTLVLDFDGSRSGHPLLTAELVPMQ